MPSPYDFLLKRMAAIFDLHISYPQKYEPIQMLSLRGSEYGLLQRIGEL